VTISKYSLPSSIHEKVGTKRELCRFFNTSNSAGDNNGGAIAAPKGSSVDIEFSTFTDNRGVFGGAVYIRASNLTLKKSIFSKNQANSAVSASVPAKLLLKRHLTVEAFFFI